MEGKSCLAEKLLLEKQAGTSMSADFERIFGAGRLLTSFEESNVTFLKAEGLGANKISSWAR